MKYIALFLLVFCTVPLSAQGNEEVVFDRVTIQGGFGGPIIEMTSIDDQAGVLFGGGGGVILNNFFIGGFGQGSGFAEHPIDDRIYSIQLAYGGLWMGYGTPNNKAIHFFSSLKLGGGSVNIPGDDNGDPLFEENIFVVQPEIGVEINLLKWCRLALTADYRVVGGIQSSRLAGLSNSDFDSPGGTLTLRFGTFSRNRKE